MGGVAWTEEEDDLLKKCIERYGEGKWHRVPLLAGLNRCRKSCRLRWLNYLRPNLKRGSFTEEEVQIIIKLHSLLGNRWSLIAGRLPGRTANDVKNYWNCHLSKKLNTQAAKEKRMARNNKNNNTDQVLMPKTPNADQETSIDIGHTTSESPNFLQPQEHQESGSLFRSEYVNYNYDNGQEYEMFPEDLCLDQQGINVGTMPLDVHFEGVEEVIGNEKEGSSGWEWDDLTLDMDLWNGCL